MGASYTEPVDFDEFWGNLYSRASEVDPNVTRMTTLDADRELVQFTSLGGVRLGGWLVRPAGEVRSAVIVGHGYGGRDDLEQVWVPEGAAAFYPIARGLPTLSPVPGIPSTALEHVLLGIESRETYVHGGCVADLWVAVRVFEELLGKRLGGSHGGLRLGYYGPSFGGGIGALALPWESRLDAASLYVPSFAANDRRLAVPCVGSGAALSQWVAEHPEAMDVLAYFDAEFAARRIEVPTIIAAAIEDPAVPPVAQWAIANAVPDRFSDVVSMIAGHRDYPEEAAEMAEYAARTRELFAAR